MIRWLFLILMFVARNSFAYVQVYGIGAIGDAKATETSSGNTFVHTNTFFVGHFGIGAGTRLGVNLGSLNIGGIAEGAWVGNSFDRKQTGAVNDSTYRYESTRLILGATASLSIGSILLLAEYYPTVQNSVSYSDDKSQNPFRKNDKLKATGYAFGFGYLINSNMSMNFLYRVLTYDNVEMNGTAVNLPSTQYTTFVFNEVTFGPTYTF